MYDDPIVASVRKTRDELAGSFGYDVHAIFADIRTRESQLGDRLVPQVATRRPNQTMHPSGGSGGLPVDKSSTAAE